MQLTSTANNREKGKQIETQACKLIAKQGLKLLERNFTKKTGEIDIIALDQNQDLVFIEVRFRQNQNFGEGFETVDFKKQQKIINTAKLFLSSQIKYQHHACRFDIISASTYNGELQLKWLKHAFEEEY